MKQIVVQHSDNRVVGIYPDDTTINPTATRIEVEGYADLGFVNQDTATVYTATPPTEDTGRYTYDPETGTFTDTWPYAALTKVQFLDLLQSAGGVSDSTLVSSRQDNALAGFWLKFELAVDVSRDDTKTQNGLDALVSAGYLDSSGKQAVLDNWPRGRS